MSETDLHELIITVFAELRRLIPLLGLRDLLDALQLAEGSAEIADLRADIELLWCRKEAEREHFRRLWEEPPAQKTPPSPPPEEPPPPPEDRQTHEHEEPLPVTEHRYTLSPLEPRPSPSFPVVAVKPPSRLPLRSGPAELSGFWPISRRAMEYGREYLRCPRRDGPATIIDIDATVEKAARQGYLLDTVYRREMSDHSHLVLLVDRKGSMTPFHPLARDLVATAMRSAEEKLIGRLDVYYFRNVATASFHIDPFLGELDRIDGRPLTMDESLNRHKGDMRIMILSDAGAARGNRALGRIEATEDMMAHLSRRTKFIAWLNPMPEKRWRWTSASIIARMVPMFEMTKLGFHRACRALRGRGERQKWRDSRFEIVDFGSNRESEIRNRR